MYWAVAATKPRQEIKAQYHLKRQGFETLLPRFLERQKIGLLFPGYIFIAIRDHWYSILSTFGVLHLLRQPDYTPAKLPEGFVDEIYSRANEDGIIVLPVRK